MAGEFDLIRRYFTRPTPQAVLGVGDDAALMQLSPGTQLAVSADMLVQGTHFFPDADPEKLGWRTLAVNVSDMAAMGAKPRWATLALALPSADETWLAAFARGFFDCAATFGVDLVGGDTTRGPLAFSVQIMGEVPCGQALRRDGAQPDDDIWVSGHLGDAMLAVSAISRKVALDEVELDACLPAFLTPQPRIALGLALRNMATSAIDISDGLTSDLGHILERSQKGAEVYMEQIPRSPTLGKRLNTELGRNCLLSGGDDYELCFTAAPAHRHRINDLSGELSLPLTRIGRITEDAAFRMIDASGTPLTHIPSGYDHFAT